MNPSMNDENPMLQTQEEWKAEVERLTEWLNVNRMAELERSKKSRESYRLAKVKHWERLASDELTTGTAKFSDLPEPERGARISELSESVAAKLKERLEKSRSEDESYDADFRDRLANADRLATNFPKEVQCLRGFYLKHDYAPEKLAAAVEWYKKDARLCDLLTALGEVFERTIGFSTNRIWPGLREKYWILPQISGSLDYIASILEVLNSQSAIRIPVHPERLKVSANNIRAILDVHHYDPDKEENDRESLEENFCETGGFPFLVDVAQLGAFEVIRRSSPKNDSIQDALGDRHVDFFDGSVKCFPEKRMIRRLGKKYEGIDASFPDGIGSDTWKFVYKLLAANGEPVEFARFLTDQSCANLRQMALTARRRFKSLDIAVMNTGKSTWKAVIKST